jgi:hypothetical protein
LALVNRIKGERFSDQTSEMSCLWSRSGISFNP